MRPQSEVRVDLAAALIDGPGTTRQLAQRTGWSIGMARTALDNMVRSGQASKGAPVRLPGCKRPVPVYHRPAPTVDSANGRPFVSLIAAWAGVGAAM